MLRRLSGLGSDRFPYLVFILVGGFVTAFVVLPMAGIFTRTLVVEGRLTLSTYADMFSRPQTIEALANTALVVGSSTVLAVLVGITLAWILTRTDVPGRKLLHVVPIMPMFLPPVVGAIGWVFLLGENAGLINVGLRAILPWELSAGPLNILSVWGMIWVISLYVTPYTYLIMASSFANFDSALEESALVCGGRTKSVLLRVTLPVLLPAIMAGGLLAFVISMAQFAIPQILGGPPGIPVITTEIYGQLRRTPRNIQGAATLSAVAVVVTATVLFAQRRVLRGSHRFVTVGGKGGRRQRTSLRKWRWPIFGAMMIYIALSVLAPVLAIVNVSLRPFWSSNLSLDQLTLSNYSHIISAPWAWNSVRNSLVYATVGASIGMSLAALTAYTVTKTKVRGRGALDYAATMPVAIPATVLGAGLLIFFLTPPFALYGTAALLIVAYVANFLPHGLRATTSAFHQVSSELEESALVCGNSRFGSMRTITIPLVAPALAGAWVFLFILMSRELSASVLLASPRTPVMALTVMELWSQGRLPDLASFSVVVLLISTLTTLLALKFGAGTRSAET